MRDQSIIILLGLLLIFSAGCKKELDMPEKKVYQPPVDKQIAAEWADSMVNQMTLDEKVALIGGDRIFFTHGIPRLGISPVLFADATQGVHLRESFGDVRYEKVLEKSTAFPSPIMLTSTWNRELAYAYAKAIGEECRAGGIAVLLGPGMNIYRISQCGRNFEYFGEDPYLAGSMIENYVVGMQETGTIATLKHFVANNTDYFRRKSNSVVDMRTLNEIYMPAFKAGIDAGAMSVMTSYNLVNGEWCGQSEYVINELLRNDLGFEWLVMTDWWSVFDGEKTILSGQDLEMPYRIATADARELVDEGRVQEADIDRMVKSILKTFYAMQAFDRKPDTTLLSKFPEHERIALQTAREGAVLLRNEGILPIDRSSNILLTGEYADKVALGGGAATVEGYDHVVLCSALTDLTGGNTSCVESPTDEQIKQADIVILAIGTFDSEGWDRDFDLPEETEQRILHTAELNRNTVVVVNSGSGINMSSWHDKVAAILYGWYPGQNGALALAEILTGKVNPSGKLPVTIEKDFSDSPGADYLPQGESLYTGWNDEQEKQREIYDIPYDEGVLVGYRWYEEKGIDPLFPFGHGLSYTQFNYEDICLSASEISRDEILEVTCKVANSGERAGAEIVQVYISDENASVLRPPKELKAFDKIWLEPGESKEVSFIFDSSALAFWDPETEAWKAENGVFDVSIGASSVDLRLKATFELIEQ